MPSTLQGRGRRGGQRGRRGRRGRGGYNGIVGRGEGSSVTTDEGFDDQAPIPQCTSPEVSSDARQNIQDSTDPATQHQHNMTVEEPDAKTGFLDREAGPPRQRFEFIRSFIQSINPEFCFNETQNLEAISDTVFSSFARDGYIKVSAQYAYYCLDSQLWEKYCSGQSGQFPFEFMQGEEVPGGKDWRTVTNGVDSCSAYEEYVQRYMVDNSFDTNDLSLVFSKTRIAESRKNDQLIAERRQVEEKQAHHPALSVWDYGKPVKAGDGGCDDQKKLKVLWEALFKTKEPLFDGMGYFELPCTDNLKSKLGHVGKQLQQLLHPNMSIKHVVQSPASLKTKLVVCMKPGTIWNERALVGMSKTWRRVKNWWLESHLHSNYRWSLYQYMLPRFCMWLSTNETLERDESIREVWKKQRQLASVVTQGVKRDAEEPADLGSTQEKRRREEETGGEH
ncbi:hypothetical protein V8F20_009510 [Naviculisporaceae sp. PSN 640]